jgi:hypothetical protein
MKPSPRARSSGDDRMRCHRAAAAAVLVSVAIALGAGAAAAVPLPRPRPSQIVPDAPETVPSAKPDRRDNTLVSQSCTLRLASAHAIFKSLGHISGPGDCGGTDVVLLERLLVNEHDEIAIEPPATLRCEMAEAVAEFVRLDLIPAVAAMGSGVRALENYDSYDCRGQNRVPGAKLSEHGKADALDIRSLRLDNGHVLHPSDIAAPKEFRLAMRSAACARFTTVLGPGSDGFHEDHIHVDLAQRSSGYRVCQWALREIGPGDPARAGESAVPLPRARRRHDDNSPIESPRP